MTQSEAKEFITKNKLSMCEVAKKAKVSKNFAFRYFTGKSKNMDERKVKRITGYLAKLMTLLLFTSCAIKKDKQSLEVKENNTAVSSKLELTHEVGKGITLRPFNPEKPIINGKDTIWNATIEKHYYDRVSFVKDTVVIVHERVVQVDSKQKETDNYLFLVIFFGIVYAVVLIYNFLKKR